jgi:hypothetical protein
MLGNVRGITAFFVRFIPIHQRVGQVHAGLREQSFCIITQLYPNAIRVTSLFTSAGADLPGNDQSNLRRPLGFPEGYLGEIAPTAVRLAFPAVSV